MKRSSRWSLSMVGLMLLALLVAACGGGGGPKVGGGNGGGGGNELRISVTASETEVNAGESIDLKATLSGSGSEAAGIRWTAAWASGQGNVGEFSSTSLKRVEWTAPSSPGEVTITAAVVGKSLSGSVNVNVISVDPEPSANCTESDPCKIRNFDDLKQISQRENRETGAVIGYYELANDIDVSGGERTLEPIGRTYASRLGGFSGHFDGNGHTIKGLLIDTSGDVGETAGVFGTINVNGVVTNVTFEDVEVSAANLIGGLVGQNAGTVRDANVSGTVERTDGLYAGVGGLAGANSGLIEGSEATVTVRDLVTGFSRSEFLAVGGLVGRNTGEIKRSKSYSEVTSSAARRHVGGLVGHNEASGFIGNSSSEGGSFVEAFVGDELGAIGGLVGFNEGDIEDSDSGASVTGNFNVGGLVGRHGQGTISESRTNASADVEGEKNVGGLVGLMRGVDRATTLEVIGSSSAANVTGGTHVGGLVGYNDYTPIVGVIERSSSNAVVKGGPYVGGLVGTNRGAVRGSHSTSDITQTAEGDGRDVDRSVRDEGTGGLVGYNHADTGKSDTALIKDSWSSGTVSGGHRVGGLVGGNHGGRIVRSHSEESAVTGDKRVGGLVGDNWQDATGHDGFIAQSYAADTVTVTGNAGGQAVGGLVGTNEQYGHIVNSYSLAKVTGDSEVGGLIGYNHATIDDSYSAGEVSGTDSDTVGGLVGRRSIHNVDVVKRSYWDIDKSGQGSSAGGDPRSTGKMKTSSAFSGWDTGIWEFSEGRYPDLKNNPRKP